MSEKLLKPIYLLYGDEFLIEQAISRLKKRLKDAGASDLDVKTFSGLTHSASEILQGAETLPFLGGKQLVVVRDFDSLGEADKEKIARYAGIPSEAAVVILVADKVGKGSRVAKAVGQAGLVFEYRSPARYEIPNWVRDRFADEGKKVAPDALTYLVSVAGSSLRDLAGEVEKVSVFVGDKGIVERADVEAAVSAKLEANVFQLVDALGHRNRGRALSLVNRLSETGEKPQYVFYMMVRQFRLILKTKGLLAERKSAAQIAKQLSQPYFAVEKYIEQSANFTLKQLTDIYRQLWETDLKVKSGEQPARLALELMIADALG